MEAVQAMFHNIEFAAKEVIRTVKTLRMQKWPTKIVKSSAETDKRNSRKALLALGYRKFN